MSTFLSTVLVLLLQGILHRASSKETINGATVKTTTHRHLQEDDEPIIEIGFLLSNVAADLSATEIVNRYEEDLNVAFDRALKESLEHDDNIFGQNTNSLNSGGKSDPSKFTAATAMSRQDDIPLFAIETAEDGTTPIRYSCPVLLEYNPTKFLNAEYYYELLSSHDCQKTNMTGMASYVERDLLIQLADDVGMINGDRCYIPPVGSLWLVDIRSKPDDEIIEYLECETLVPLAGQKCAVVMGRMEARYVGEEVSSTEFDLLVQQALLSEVGSLLNGQQDYKVAYLGAALDVTSPSLITEKPLTDNLENAVNSSSTTNTNVTEEDYSLLEVNTTVTNGTNNNGTNQSTTSSTTLLEFELHFTRIQSSPCRDYTEGNRTEDVKSCYCVTAVVRFQDNTSDTAKATTEIVVNGGELQKQLDQMALPFTVGAFCQDGFDDEDTLIVDEGMEDELEERTDPPENNPRTDDDRDDAASQTDINEADSDSSTEGIPLLSRHQASNLLLSFALFLLFA